MQAKWFGTSFVLYGSKDGFAIDSSAHASLLFAWDAPSAYGTKGLSNPPDNEYALELSAVDALRLFSVDPPVNREAQIEWNPPFEHLQAIGTSIEAAIRRGLFVPDYEQWKRGDAGWKLSAAGEGVVRAALEDEIDPPAAANGPSGIPLAHAWLDAAVRTHLSTLSEPAVALDPLIVRHPLLDKLPASSFSSEHEWLAALGLQESPAPFLTCLEIAEPVDDGDAWTVRVLLRDRDHAEAIYPAPGFERIDEEPCPPDWRAYADSVDSTIRLWTALCPELAGSDSDSGSDSDGQLLRTVDSDEAWAMLTEMVPTLMEAGCIVMIPAWWQDLLKSGVQFRAKVSAPASGKRDSLFGLSQTVNFDWRVAMGDVEISEAEFLQLVAKKRRLIRYRDRWIEISPELLQQFREVTQRGKRKHGFTFQDALEMMLLQSGSMEKSESEEERNGQAGAAPTVEIVPDAYLTSIIAQLQGSESMPDLEEPKGFVGQLRSYQRRGYSWLAFLRRFGFGACLADDMGLGKTVQYTAYLVRARAQQDDGSTDGPPALLVCPTSVLGNWQKELERFAPHLRVYLHYGTDRLKGEAFASAVQGVDLVLTSYSLCHLDTDTLQPIAWDSICLDEAQNIKNPQTKQAMAVRELTARHRIAMTGTPMENRLAELWSIFEFINPGYLGTMNRFSEHFARPIERDGDEDRVRQLQRLISPFLLRRRKNDPAVELDLPDKFESNVFVNLTREQAALYEGIVEDMLRKVDTLAPMERRGLILASLTRLKQVCDHPWLFTRDAEFRYAEGVSSKLDRLVEMVGELLSEGDSCLIFTQFVEAGNLLKSALSDAFGEEPMFLHGGLRKTARDAMVNQFQNGTGPRIFILSLKAGGVGLNLTAANHVFHFDRWWNPAVENQATDRAYRIGQTRRVQVHKFVALGTLEERIDQMIAQKRSVSDQVVGTGEAWITELSTAELQDLFQLRRSIV